MELLKLRPPSGNVVKGTVVLNGSKSIANRVQVIRALCDNPFTINNLSNADDTIILGKLLSSQAHLLDAGAGGTTYRFLTAYLATREGEEHLLTGSERMQQRPVKILVDALRSLGADITYTTHLGFPPILIKGKKLQGGILQIPADTSSQYITALLLIAPLLEGGLTLTLAGEVVSRPYIEMTLRLMDNFGVKADFTGNTITIKPAKYVSQPFYVEADWSAASYYYAMAALAEEADIELKGLSLDSLQGDAAIAHIMKPFGVETIYGEHVIRIKKKKGYNQYPNHFEYDFVTCPDLAQTVVVACAALGIPGKFHGLKTLLIKETDRVAALHHELGKYGVSFLSTQDNTWTLDIHDANFTKQNTPRIQTYEDHRMAMAFAPLALLTGEVQIEEPNVVTKSYPNFWKDLNSLGFQALV